MAFKTFNNQQAISSVVNPETFELNGVIVSSTLSELTSATQTLNNNIVVLTQMQAGDDADIENLQNALSGFAILDSSNTFTGQLNTFDNNVACNNLTVVSGIALPNNSISDNALTTNIPKLNQTNVFTGTNNFTGTITTTQNASQSNHIVNKSHLDTQLATKQNTIINTTDLSFRNLNATGTISIPSNSIADGYLSNNIPKLNGSNYFTEGLCDFSTATTSQIPTSNNHIVNKLYTDTQIATKQNTITTTTDLSFRNLTASGTITMPNNSISDNALSTNIPKKNQTNVFTGTNDFETLTTTRTATENNMVVNKFVLDNGLNTKQNTITTTTDLSFQNLTASGTITLPNNSINDNALSTNIPRLNGASNTFTTLSTTRSNPTQNNHVVNKEHLDTRLTAKQDTITTTTDLSFRNLTASGTINIPNNSISDNALSNRVIKYDNTGNLSLTGGTLDIGTDYNFYTNLKGSLRIGNGLGSIVYDGTTQTFNEVPVLSSNLTKNDITLDNHFVNKKYVDDALEVSTNRAYFNLNTIETFNSGNTNPYTLIPPYLNNQIGIRDPITFVVRINPPPLSANNKYKVWTTSINFNYWIIPSNAISGSYPQRNVTFPVVVPTNPTICYSNNIIITASDSENRAFAVTPLGSRNAYSQQSHITQFNGSGWASCVYTPITFGYSQSTQQIILNIQMPLFSNVATASNWIASMGFCVEMSSNSNGYISSASQGPQWFVASNKTDKMYFSQN